METKLAVPIAAQDLEVAERQIKAAVTAGAEMLELRTDYLENLSTEVVQKLIVEAKSVGTLPIIVTCRDKRQGGAIEYPNTLRVDVLVAGLEGSANFIDFEYENFLILENQERIKTALAKNSSAGLILSAHNFQTRFADITKLYRDILTVYPAAIPKLIYTANHINDCFEAFDLLHKMSSDSIVFCMGAAGLISRIIAKKLSGFVSFASIDEKSTTAPGQLTIEQLKKLYRWNDIKTDTQLYGIIGSPIAHSLSPAVHNGCFAEIGANKLYFPLLIEGGVEEFNEFMDNILTREWLNFGGLSVTIPHKQNALNYVKQKGGFVEPLAEKIGAANTIIINEQQISVYNTDYAGALDAMTAGMNITRADLKDLPVAVIGAGGIARAIVAGLGDIGAKIKIYNRTVEKAEKLAGEFGCEFAGLDDLPSIDAKLVI